MEKVAKVDADHRKAFNEMMKKLKKKHPDSIWYKEKTSYAPDVERLWLPSLDIALGTCGLPMKRIIELFGPEASGKTSLCLHVIAQVQKRGGNVLFVDAENSLDPEWAEKLGVDIGNLGLIQQNDAETALNIVREAVQSNTIDLVVVDSVAALVTRGELESQMEDHHVGVQARLMSRLMKYINVDLMPTKTIALFTNQIREKIGVKFGNPETTPGGRALKFYASMRLDVKKASDDEAYKMGHHVAKVRVAKNKLAPPFGQGIFRINPEVGILASYSILDPAVEYGIISHEKGSKKFSYNGTDWTFQSKVIKALDEDENLRKEIMDKLYKAWEATTVITQAPEAEVPEPTAKPEEDEDADAPEMLEEE